MATIPKSDTLSLRQPQQTGAVVQTPDLQLYQPKQVGAAVELLKEEQRKLDASELASAKVQFQLGQIEAAERFADDPDLETVNERYEQAMNEHLAKASAQISNAETRMLFNEGGQVQVAQGQLQMAADVEVKMTDRERASNIAAFTKMIQAAQDPNQNIDPAETMATISDMTMSTMERGRMTAVERETFLNEAANEIALGRLKAMDPATRMGALEEDWAENLAPDVLAKLRRDTEAQMVAEIAQDYAYQLAMMKDDTGQPINTYKANLEIYDKFKDAPNGAAIIRAARTEFGLLMQNREASMAGEAVAVYNDVDLQVRTSEPPMTVADLYDPNGPYLNKIELMDAAQRQNLEAYLTRRSAGVVRTSSDRTTLFELRRLYAQGPEKRAAALKYFTDNWEKFNDTDWKFWNKELIDAEVTGLFDAQTVLLKQTEKFPWKRQAALFSGLNKWYMGEYERLGAPPTDEQVQAQIDRALGEIKREGIFTREKLPYEMDLDERVDAFAEMGKAEGVPDIQKQLNREEFLANYSPMERMEIQYTHLRNLNETVFNEQMTRWKAEGKPFNYEEFETEFLMDPRTRQRESDRRY